MKITSIETLLLRTGSIFVRVRTDQAVDGIGECSPMNPQVLAHFVDTVLSPLVVGEDPRNIDRLWHKMFFATYKLGVQGIQPEAIAGIDIALWDLLGKVTGLPICILLGGRHRERVTMYKSIGGGAKLTPKEMGARVEQALEQGFRAVKIRMDWGAARRDADPEKDWEMARLARKLCGDGFPLMFDANNGYSVATAVRQGRRLESIDVLHFEEPVAQYDYPGIAQVSDALDLPISAGEHEYTRWQFQDLIERARVDIIQPDVVKCAGLTEMRRISVLGSVHDKHIVPHQTQPTIGTAANLHLVAAQHGCNRPQEFTGPRPELEDLFVEPLAFEDGTIRVPERPGLGLELDERKLKSALA